MTTSGNEQRREIQDALIAAYCDMQGLRVRTKPVGEGRIAFEISGGDVDGELDRYYQNPKVALLTFIASYKRVKSMLYNNRKTS